VTVSDLFTSRCGKGHTDQEGRESLFKIRIKMKSVRRRVQS